MKMYKFSFGKKYRRKEDKELFEERFFDNPFAPNLDITLFGYIEKESYISEKEKERNEERKENYKLVWDIATDKLTDRQFQIFYFYYNEGWPMTLIGKMFNITQPRVAVVLKASIKKIRKALNIS